MQISRRRFFQGAFAAIPCGFGYSSLLEPHWLEVTHTKIRAGAKSLPGPVRVLHLSDFHLSEDVPLSLIAKSIALGIAQKPDLIFLTGDFVTRHLSQEKDYAAELRKLAEAAPAFVSLGNHDGGLWAANGYGYDETKDIRDFVSGAGLRVLHNESVIVRAGKTSLRLTGLGDLWSGEFRPADAFGGVNDAAADAHVLLSHNPDTKDEVRDFAWDLMLCGHTHGGQISLPLIGGGVFAPVRDSRYISGRYDWNGRQLYVTRGVGSIHGLRFNCRPEVSVLELV